VSEYEDHTANIPLNVSVPERLTGTGGEHVLVRLGQPETSAYVRLGDTVALRPGGRMVGQRPKGRWPQPPAISRRDS
jgi:hypothetical protein